MKKPVPPFKKFTKINSIVPKTINQNTAMKAFKSGNNLAMLGCAGTGKTFLALYLALSRVVTDEYSRVILVRSAVPVRDIGFLPGDVSEKTSYYEMPYRPMCDEFFPFSRSYDTLKNAGQLEFYTTSFIRGITFYNSIVVVDECQSLNGHELDSIITRLGTHCRLILCGDSIQTDLRSASERRGFMDVIRILQSVPDFSTIEFTSADIVRSGFVRDYIISRDMHGLIC